MASAWDTYSQEESGETWHRVAETMKNTARARKLEHREISSKILQANQTQRVNKAVSSEM